MGDLILTSEQAAQFQQGMSPLLLRDPEGNVLGTVSPLATGSAKQSGLQQDFVHQRFPISQQMLAALCQRFGVSRLSLFGSALGADFGPRSDLDVLVEFAPDIKVGLSFFQLERELSELAGRKVDLNTQGFLSEQFRGEVLAQAQVLYDASAG